MVDYIPKRMNFLWVRWYDHEEGEDLSCLDSLFFRPVDVKGAFGFVDLADVIRSCHVIPRFSQGKQHPDGQGLSELAKDSQDWITYNIGR